MEYGGNRPGGVAIGVLTVIGLLIAVLLVLVLIFGFQIPLSPVSEATAGGKQPEATTPASASGPQTLSFAFEAQDKTTPWALVSNGANNPTIKARVGATVKITFQNTGQTPHTWTLDANSPSPYYVSTALVDPGRSETVSFVADKPGTFTYYCKVPGHKNLGMKGTIIIES